MPFFHLASPLLVHLCEISGTDHRGKNMRTCLLSSSKHSSCQKQSKSPCISRQVVGMNQFEHQIPRIPVWGKIGAYLHLYTCALQFIIAEGSSFHSYCHSVPMPSTTRHQRCRFGGGAAMEKEGIRESQLWERKKEEEQLDIEGNGG